MLTTDTAARPSRPEMPSVAFWDVFDDIQDSYALALRHAGVDHAIITGVTTTVTDYAANHYGDN